MAKAYEKYSINPITGDALVTKSASPAYCAGYDEIFALSFFEANKKYRQQMPHLYNDGWSLYSVEQPADGEKQARILLKNEDGGVLQVFIDL